MKLRIGVVGLGDHWEKRYRPALLALSDRFEVRAVCDSVALRAERAAEDLRAAAVDGYHGLARRSDVDAVLVLSGSFFGRLPVLAACNAGKAVYCREALGRDESIARRLKERIEASGVAFMAEFPRRLAPATERLKELLATRLGQPRLLFSHVRLPGESAAAPGCAATDPVFDQIVQLIDWCSFVVQARPESVAGVAGWEGEAGRAPTYRMLSLRFPAVEDGTPPVAAQISCGRYFPAAWHEAIHFRPPAELQVCCENGVAFVDPPASLVWFDEAGRHRESLENERPLGETLFLQFYRSVTSLVRSANLQDAWQALEVALAASESFRCGRWVSLP